MKRKSTRDLVMSENKRQKPSEDNEFGAESRPTITVTTSHNNEDIPGDETPEYLDTAKSHKREKKKNKTKRPKAERKSFPPIFKSRTFWGCLSLVAAFLLAFVAMPLLEEKQNDQMVSVVVAAEDIPEGVKITGDMLIIEEKHSTDVPENALLSKEEAIGRFSSYTIIAEDVITPVKISNDYYDDDYLYDLPDGKMAISVELAGMAQNVSGKLRSGDVVRIYAVYDDEDLSDNTEADYEYDATLIPELEYVEVLAVTNDDLQDIQSKESSDDAESGDTDNNSIAAVTLLVNNQQAMVLAGLNDNATLYAALVVRGDDAKKQAALDAEDSYLELIAAQEESAERDNNDTEPDVESEAIE